MRLVLALAVLALAWAAPVYASPEAATGGATMPPGTTGGMTAPGWTGYGKVVEGTPPAGGTEGGYAAERSPAEPRSERPVASSASSDRARAAQDGQPDAPSGGVPPDEDDVDVQVPIDGGERQPRATEPTPSGGSSLGGLAATGLTVAAFALLGAGAAAAGIGLRRLAR